MASGRAENIVAVDKKDKSTAPGIEKSDKSTAWRKYLCYEWEIDTQQCQFNAVSSSFQFKSPFKQFWNNYWTAHIFRNSPNMENTQDKSAPKMIRKPRTITESSSSSDTSFAPSSFSSSSSADMMEAMDRIALEWGNSGQEEEETEEEIELRKRLEFAQWKSDL